MRVVQKLPEHVINQIKAGEVVERPVSVVKELLENALDAEAQEIEIELIDGGRQLIRIADDGSGMSRADAEMALERHATSKITRTEDLQELSTFGFRGEALPSIAAVSDFTLRTRTKDATAGTEIHVQGGRQAEAVNCGCAVGTEIVVRNLFESIPARRKFLRSTATEFAHIQELVQAMALAYFKVGFRLSHNGREVFNVAPAQSLHDRFKALLGSEAKEFLPVHYEKGSFRLEGFVQQPDQARPVPRYFITFVNGRLVKDRIVRNGVLSGYTGLVMKGLVPACVLFVTVDPHILDVNAHPNKTEIRFTDAALVQDLVTIALQADLRKSTQSQMLSTLPTAETIVRVSEASRRGEWSPSELTQPELFASARSSQPELFAGVRSSNSAGLNAIPRSAGSNSAYHSVSQFSSPPSAQPGARVSPQSEENFSLEPRRDEASNLHRAQITSRSDSPLLNSNYLGQYKNCYLLFQADEDLLVVDQHAFHERILFEELAVQLESEHGLAKQSLLAPLMVPIPATISEVLKEEEKALAELGFEIETFSSGRSVALHSVPTQVDLNKAAEIFDEVIARLLAIRGFHSADAHPLVQRAHRLNQEWLDVGVRPANLSRRELFHLHIATVACHSAVRSGDPLNAELVRRLLLRGQDVDFFAHCPHGRPVWRRWSAQDVAQWFSRI